MTNENKKEKYQWMSDEQKALYNDLCKCFSLKSLTDVGKFLGSKAPYHTGVQIFKTRKPNNNLLILVREVSQLYSELEEARKEIETYRKLKESINEIERGLDDSFIHLQKIRERLK